MRWVRFWFWSLQMHLRSYCRKLPLKISHLGKKEKFTLFFMRFNQKYNTNTVFYILPYNFSNFIFFIHGSLSFSKWYAHKVLSDTQLLVSTIKSTTKAIWKKIISHCHQYVYNSKHCWILNLKISVQHIIYPSYTIMKPVEKVPREQPSPKKKVTNNISKFSLLQRENSRI